MSSHESEFYHHGPCPNQTVYRAEDKADNPETGVLSGPLADSPEQEQAMSRRQRLGRALRAVFEDIIDLG